MSFHKNYNIGKLISQIRVFLSESQLQYHFKKQTRTKERERERDKEREREVPYINHSKK